MIATESINPKLTIPPLENGDKLTRTEFERRYHAMPDRKKAELIVEIAASSVSIDLHQKRNVYRRNQVQEYLVWRVDDGELDWFRLENEEYIKSNEQNSEYLYSSLLIV